MFEESSFGVSVFYKVCKWAAGHTCSLKQHQCYYDSSWCEYERNVCLAQAASWLDAAPAGLDDFLQEADREDLRELLTNQSCLLGRASATGTKASLNKNTIKSWNLFTFLGHLTTFSPFIIFYWLSNIAFFFTVGHDTETILLSAWTHPLFTKLTNPDPPPANTDLQSDPLPDVSSPIQLDVELVKVEVVVMTEDEREQVEETVIGQTVTQVEQEASNESSVVGGDECAVAPVILEADRWDTSSCCVL